MTKVAVLLFSLADALSANMHANWADEAKLQFVFHGQQHESEVEVAKDADDWWPWSRHSSTKQIDKHVNGKAGTGDDGRLLASNNKADGAKSVILNNMLNASSLSRHLEANHILAANSSASSGHPDKSNRTEDRSILPSLSHSSFSADRHASGASAKGDPHMQNTLGESFDLVQPGEHVLVHVPREAPTERALLHAVAKAKRVGGACADVYLETLNVTGAWASKRAWGGLFFRAAAARPREVHEWMRVGRVDLKVVHGRTRDGTVYLNVLFRNLDKVGFAVGGLLGEDSHQAASAPNAGCERIMSLPASPRSATL